MADFFLANAPHDGLKKVIYKKYLQAFVAKILNYQRNAVIIDGFAGDGRLGDIDIGIESYSTPLIILIVVLQFYTHYFGRVGEELCGHTFIYLLESELEEFEALKRNIKRYLQTFPPLVVDFGVEEDLADMDIGAINPLYPITLRLRRQKFVEFQREMIHNSTTLTILDPDLYKLTPMQHVQQFLDPTSEVMILFLSCFVNMDCEVYNEDVAALYGIDMPEGNIDDFVGIVRNNPGDDPFENPIYCTKRYIQHIKNRTGSAFGISFEIRGRNNNVLCHLIHFTNHRWAFQSMKETFNTCSQYEGEFKMSNHRVLTEGFPLTFENTQNDEELSDTIYQEYSGRTVMLSEIHDYVLEHTRFVFRTNALKRMEEEPVPRITHVVDGNNGHQQRRRGCYPRWGNWQITFLPEL